MNYSPFQICFYEVLRIQSFSLKRLFLNVSNEKKYSEYFITINNVYFQQVLSNEIFENNFILNWMIISRMYFW